LVAQGADLTPSRFQTRVPRGSGLPMRRPDRGSGERRSSGRWSPPPWRRPAAPKPPGTDPGAEHQSGRTVPGDVERHVPQAQPVTESAPAQEQARHGYAPWASWLRGSLRNTCASPALPHGTGGPGAKAGHGSGSLCHSGMLSCWSGRQPGATRSQLWLMHPARGGPMLFEMEAHKHPHGPACAGAATTGEGAP